MFYHIVVADTFIHAAVCRGWEPDGHKLKEAVQAVEKSQLSRWQEAEVVKYDSRESLAEQVESYNEQ